MFTLAALMAACYVFWKYDGDNGFISASELVCAIFWVSTIGWVGSDHYFLIAGLITSFWIVIGSLEGANKNLLKVMLFSVCVNFWMCLEYKSGVYTLIDVYYTELMRVVMLAQVIASWYYDKGAQNGLCSNDNAHGRYAVGLRKCNKRGAKA